jgi:GNAT superfamily N-acetyltransferase
VFKTDFKAPSTAQGSQYDTLRISGIPNAHSGLHSTLQFIPMTIQQITPGSAHVQSVWQLRETVLRKPIGLSLLQEDLSEETGDCIFGAIENGVLVGCLFIRPLPEGKGKLRQMAVDPDYQGRGIGAALLEAAETYALDQGMLFLELHARETAVEFYTKAGYHISGDRFTEVGIPHLKMIKSLSQ